jgi:hypothetical protein
LLSIPFNKLSYFKKHHGGFPPGFEDAEVFICDECPEQFLTTKGLNQHKSQSHHQIGGVSEKKFICDRCDTGKDILIYGRNTRPNFIL